MVKSGKRFATVSAQMASAGRTTIAVLGTFGDLGAGAAAASEFPTRVEATPPDLPPVEECLTMTRRARGRRRAARLHVEDRPAAAPDDAGFMLGMPSGLMRVSGWFRLRDEAGGGHARAARRRRRLPPTIFNASLPVGWTPTVELTAHVQARPAPGWLRCVFTTRFVTGGFIEEDGEVWDDTGTLVAQSRQLALVPAHPPTGSYGSNWQPRQQSSRLPVALSCQLQRDGRGDVHQEGAWRRGRSPA